MLLCLRSCEEKPEITTTTVIKEKIILIHDTVFKGEGKGKLRYTYGGMVHDTILERVVITTERGDTIKEFTATLDTVQHGDTLHIGYAFPASIFSYSLNRAPIEIRYMDTTTTKTIYIQPSRWGLGVQAGVGVVRTFSGNTDFGYYGGVGINYTL